MARLKLRSSVLAAAEAMERKLRTHDKDRGEAGWINNSPVALLSRVFDEYMDLREALDAGDYDRAREEAIDVMNMAHMVFDVCSILLYQAPWRR